MILPQRKGAKGMITTVCMNPSFDKTAFVDGLTLGRVNRLEGVRVDVGGKGVNVAVVLSRLGVRCGCVGCLGERGEADFVERIARENVAFDYLRLPGEVRTNLKLVDRKTKAITEFNEQGLQMDEEQFRAFGDLLCQKAAGSEYVVFSGRLPAGCADTAYQRLLQALPRHKCVLDASGDAMLGGILMGLSRGESLADSFRYGVAAGAASVMTDGTQLVRKDDFDALLPKVTVRNV